MQKRIVFHVISRFDMGGAERVALNIACSKRYDTVFHLIEVARGKSNFSDSFVREMQEGGIVYHRSLFPSKKLGILFFPFFFHALVIRYRPNIIHSHTEVPDVGLFIWYILLGFLYKKIKYVRTIHNTKLWGKWAFVGNKVEEFFIKKGANIAIGKNVADCYEERFHQRAPIIYNGVPKIEQRPFSGIIPNKINIIFAGRLEPQKGVDTMIEVVSRLRDNSDLFFHVVGKGSMQNKVDSALGKCPNVKRYDCIYGLSGYLSSFDYVFFPSLFEGLVLFSIESSMAKVPVIANKCRGLDETLPDNWPLTVYNNNVNDFVSIFLKIGSFDRETLGEMSFSYVEKKFSIENMQNNYEELYKRLSSI